MRLKSITIKQSRRGITLLEVLVGLGIMMAGLLAIATVIPSTLQAHNEAEILTQAAMLAQGKVAEIRRDDSATKQLKNQIRSMTTPSQPIPFIYEPRLTYSFSGVSIMYADMVTPTMTLEQIDPRARPGIPRVLIRYAPEFRPTQDVIYELLF